MSSLAASHRVDTWKLISPTGVDAHALGWKGALSTRGGTPAKKGSIQVEGVIHCGWMVVCGEAM